MSSVKDVKKRIAEALGEAAGEDAAQALGEIPQTDKQTTTQGETTMSSMTDKPNQTLHAVTVNLKHGAKIAGSEEACDLMIGILRRTLGDTYPKFFDTALGHMLEPLFVASAVHYLSTQYGFIPNCETVAKVAEYCMQGTGREMMATLLQQLEPAFEAITKIKVLEEAPEKDAGRKKE
ncbi:MAG TPA: hypothetical protein VMX18_04635 [Candidatus Bipolaricaulota bacterium]|nr:hypothetical protein [Candidatus Bipolaricaulota bacterium]